MLKSHVVGQSRLIAPCDCHPSTSTLRVKRLGPLVSLRRRHSCKNSLPIPVPDSVFRSTSISYQSRSPIKRSPSNFLDSEPELAVGNIPTTVSTHHGCFCGSEAASADEVPSRVRSEGGHAEGQCGGHEEVRITFDLEAHRADQVVDGLQARSLKYLALKMTSLSSYASTSLRVRAS